MYAYGLHDAMLTDFVLFFHVFNLYMIHGAWDFEDDGMDVVWHDERLD